MASFMAPVAPQIYAILRIVSGFDFLLISEQGAGVWSVDASRLRG